MKHENAKEDLLLFEGTILSHAVHPNAARSGIFTVTFEVFKQFLSRDVHMLVMCDILMYSSMKKTLREYFAGSAINVMYYVRWGQSPGGSSFFEVRFRRVPKCVIFAILQAVMSVVNLLNGKWKRAHNAKTFFSAAYVPPRRISKNKSIKKYICLYDAIPILYREYFPQMEDSFFWYRLLVDQINGHDHYFAISRATKNDFCRLFHDRLSEEQVTVAYLGKNERYRWIEQPDGEILEKYGIGKGNQYFFSLCTVEPRKNLIRSVKSFLRFIEREKITDLYYVIGGGKWEEFYSQLMSEMKEEGLFERYVKMIGYVDITLE